MKNKNLDAFMAQLSKSFNDASSFRENRLEVYKDSYNYYMAKLPKEFNGQSYVEPVMRKTVDSILPVAHNVFTENASKAVNFRPENKTIKQPLTSAINEAINEIYLRKNDGFNFASKVIKEALITGDCFAKVFIDETMLTKNAEIKDFSKMEEAILETDDGQYLDITTAKQEYPDTDFSVLEKSTRTTEVPINPAIQKQMAVASGSKIDSVMKVEEEVVKGKLVLTKIERVPRIDMIDFYEFFVDPNCLDNDVRKARYCCHRVMITRSQLIERGFDEDKVMCIPPADCTEETETNKDMLTLGVMTSESAGEESPDPLEQNVFLYEHYIYSSLLNKGNKTNLYQVFTGSRYGNLIEINEAQRIPYVHGVPYQLNSSFWGMSLYDYCKDNQDLISSITRMIKHSGMTHSYDQYIATRGGVEEKTLMDRRPGGIIFEKQPNAVRLMPSHQLPQEVILLRDQILNNIQEQKANSLGLDTVSGLNNVAASTMAMAVSNQEMLDKVIIKTLAHTFFKPLFEELYALIRDEDYPIEVAVEVSPQIKQMAASQGFEIPETQIVYGSALPSRCNFVIDVNTANDQARQAGQLMNILQTAMTLQLPIVDEQKAYNILSQNLEVAGISDPDAYLINPSDKVLTPEEQAAAAQAQAVAEEDAKILRELNSANLQLTVFETAKVKVETDEMIKNGDTDRKIKMLEALAKMETADATVLEKTAGIELDKASHNLEVVNSAQDRIMARLDAEPQAIIHT